MVLTVHSGSVDSVLFGLDKPSDSWCIMALEDTCRVSIPLHPPQYTEHYPVGLAVSYNSTLPVPISKYHTSLEPTARNDSLEFKLRYCAYDKLRKKILVLLDFTF